MMTQLFDLLPPWEESEELAEVDDEIIRVAVLGRPNVGKSTLVNRLLGEDRVLTYDMPGTTRDTIEVEFERDGLQYKILDTAGVRRRKNITEAVEKFSVIKALQAIEKSQVIVLMVDAVDGMTDQDATLLGHVLNHGRGLVVAINKWDSIDAEQRLRLKSELDRKLTYAEFARRITISALHGSGLRELMNAINESWRSAALDMSTTRLTEVVRSAWEAHQPAMKHGRTAKLRFAHSGGKFPPRIIIHGRRVDTISTDYRRYMTNKIRAAFKIRGTPIWIGFREGDNPFKNKQIKDEGKGPTKKQKKAKVGKRIRKVNR